MKKKHIYTAIQVVLIAVMLFFGWKIISHFQLTNELKEEQKEVTDQVDEVRKGSSFNFDEYRKLPPKKKEEKKEEARQAAKEVLASLRKKNKDVVAYIEIPDTHIAYPVLQGETNDSYFRTNLYGEHSIAGSIFMEADNEKDFSDFNTVILGHMMDTPTMFADLKYFLHKDFVEGREEFPIYITTDEGTQVWHVFSALKVPSDKDYHMKDPSQEERDHFYHRMLDQSYFTFEKPEGTPDRILTLTTCTEDYDSSKRIAIFCFPGE